MFKYHYSPNSIILPRMVKNKSAFLAGLYAFFKNIYANFACFREELHHLRISFW